MAEQYWIGGFFIDLSRNQITQNQQSQTIPPKALAVLTYLAENQGKVVSHDDLLTEVWQNTAVSPNTLQKSIAQLRKALGDDGNIYIKTHAKKGYSLECDVRWQNSGNSALASATNNQAEENADQGVERHANSSNIDSIDNSIASKSSIKLLLIVAGLISVSVIAYLS